MKVTRFLVSVLMALGATPSHAADKCEALKSFPIGDGRIVSATAVPASFVTPAFFSEQFIEASRKQAGYGINAEIFGKGLVKVSFCRVDAVLTPTSDSEIEFELWLPNENYTGRLIGIGNAGTSGGIWYSAMSRHVNRGYAAFGTDRGHKGTSSDLDWAVGHPEKATDFSWRATALSAAASKAILERYYGQPAKHTYFNGCSGGGHQAYNAATMSPELFDGIIGGDAAYQGDTDIIPSREASFSALTSLSVEKIALLTQAAVAACDKQDGVNDGIINDPLQCKFDPSTLQCPKGVSSSCLTNAEVKSAKAMYASGIQPGGEYNSALMAIGLSVAAAETKPKHSPAEYAEAKKMVWLSRATPEQRFMQGFASRGGKFIAYSQYNSPLSPGVRTYHEAMITHYRNEQGLSRAQAIALIEKSRRLFMIPGAAHCFGGPGANNISATGTQPERSVLGPDRDVVTALEFWVEKGIAPDYLIATKYVDDDPSKPIVMERPICSYPTVAKWDGKGDPADHRSFSCVADGK